MIRVRGQLESVHLQKIPQKSDSYSIWGADEKRTGLITVEFDEEERRPTGGYCMPVMFPYGGMLEGLLLVSTGHASTEFRRVGFFESDDGETHEKLARRKSNEVAFTIV